MIWVIYAVVSGQLIATEPTPYFTDQHACDLYVAQVYQRQPDLMCYPKKVYP